MVNISDIGFSEITKNAIEGDYLIAWGWITTSGHGGSFPYTPPAGWEWDERYPDEISRYLGVHGGCTNCIMTLCHLRAYIGINILPPVIPDYSPKELGNGSLFILSGINEYRTGYIETKDQTFTRPDLSSKYGCPNDPKLWHIDCFYDCGGSAKKPTTLQGQINWALDAGKSYSFVAVTSNFLESYKSQIYEYIKTGHQVYKITSNSGGGGIDGHCHTISGEKILLPSIWVCDNPLNGIEHDQYGNTQSNPVCNAPSVWDCNSPLDGKEHDQYGNIRKNPVCDAPTTPETPETPETPGTEKTFMEKYGLYIGIGIIVLVIIILIIR